ncbi:hypothetical protein BJ912DRAFT_1013634 [Pholiota molesta]|nr:hypothetical protein BJ912DRAFT_1013634 [Pholiota molesta]
MLSRRRASSLTLCIRMLALNPSRILSTPSPSFFSSTATRLYVGHIVGVWSRTGSSPRGPAGLGHCGSERRAWSDVVERTSYPSESPYAPYPILSSRFRIPSHFLFASC